MIEGPPAKMIWQRSLAELQKSISFWHATPDVSFREIFAAAHRLSTAIRNGNMIFAAGNGGSAAQAQHFVAELVGRFMKARPGLPALALNADTAIITALANDFGYEEVFARQLEAYATQEDVLVVFSTSGTSPNILKAIERARQLGMIIIALVGPLSPKLSDDDVHALLRMPSQSTAHIQELHLFVAHVLCEIIEETL